MKDVINQIASKHNLKMDQIAVWCDYHSIPQKSPNLLVLAIRSLSVYSRLANVFVAVTPAAEHVGTKMQCDFESYQKRGWVRNLAFRSFHRMHSRTAQKGSA
eukprot:2270603-Prymnesium_polylepis.2